MGLFFNQEQIKVTTLSLTCDHDQVFDLKELLLNILSVVVF